MVGAADSLLFGLFGRSLFYELLVGFLNRLYIYLDRSTLLSTFLIIRMVKCIIQFVIFVRVSFNSVLF